MVRVGYTSTVMYESGSVGHSVMVVNKQRPATMLACHPVLL